MIDTLENEMRNLISRIDAALSHANMNDRSASISATNQADAIRNIRRGREPGAIRLKALAQTLNVSTDWLLGLCDDPDISLPAPAPSGHSFSHPPAWAPDEAMQELVIDSSAFRPDFERGELVLYDPTVNTVSESGLYVFQDNRTGRIFPMRAKHAFGSENIQIWDNDPQNSDIVSLDYLEVSGPHVIGLVVGKVAAV